MRPSHSGDVTRKSDGRMIAGVCAGFAERFDVSVTVIRLAFVIAALFSALGPAVILQVVLSVIMPVEEPGYYRGELVSHEEAAFPRSDRPDYL